MLGNRRQSLTSGSYPAMDFNLTLIHLLSRSEMVVSFSNLHVSTRCLSLFITLERYKL